MVDPRLPAEWQEAVDAADWCLGLDSARRYGLVAGGPEIDVARCEEILAAGAAFGYTPSADSVERSLAELVRGAPA